jgi:CDP-glycerol glycerophosphotransferase (TagB/SpsB family)
MAEKPDSTCHIRLHNIGYPKLDDQISGHYDRRDVLEKAGLDPSRKTIIYAPAWDPGGALRTWGPVIPQLLLEAGDVNVMVKLHPASLEPPDSPNYQMLSGGIVWPEVFKALEANPRFRYIDAPLVNPLLAAADIMVTDFSGVALEFMTLDRPVIYLHCPEFYEKTLVDWGNDPAVSLHDERFNAGRNAGLVIMHPEELATAVQRSLAVPDEFADKRHRLMEKFIYNPGRGSSATVEAMTRLLDDRAKAKA